MSVTVSMIYYHKIFSAICINGYTLRPPANEYCYKYYQIDEDYSAANRSCVRDGASLVFINSSEENAYLRDNFFDPNGQTEFWIGLNDLDVEGVFMYACYNVSYFWLLSPWTCVAGGLLAVAT